MALLDATTANDDIIVVAFSDDDDDDDDESMMQIFNRLLFPIERRVRFCAPPPRAPRRRKCNGEGENAVPSFDMCARKEAKKQRESGARALCARVCLVHKGNECQMRKDHRFFEPKKPPQYIRKRKEKDEIYDFVMRGIIFIK
jgi:hypothetical protein